MSISQNFPAISPTLNLNFARSKKLDPRITFTRTSSATRTNAQGLVETVSANIPRFDHSYNSSTGSVNSLGLLVEESRTNLFLRSQDLLTSPNATAAGLGSYFTATVDALPSPSGSTNETVKFVSTPTTSQGLFLRQTGLSLTAQTYTVSVYVYVPTQAGITNWNMNYDFQDADGVDSSLQTIFDKWVRISTTKTLTSTRNFLDFNIRINNSTAPTASGFTFYAWGAQLEAGAFPTSYIPTVASTVTRNTDNATMTGTNFTSWYNPSEGTLFAAARVSGLGGGTYPGIVYVDDGTVNNCIGFYINDATSDNIGAEAYISNVGQYQIATSSAIVPNQLNKVISAYKVNDFAAAFSMSGTVGTDASGSIPTVNRLIIGDLRGNSAKLNGTISQLLYYPKRLTNSQLQNLTK